MFMEGSLMSEFSMINWLLELFVSYKTVRYFLDFLNLSTVLKLDIATYIVHFCPAVIGMVYRRSYVSRLFTFLQFAFAGWVT